MAVFNTAISWAVMGVPWRLGRRANLLVFVVVTGEPVPPRGSLHRRLVGCEKGDRRKVQRVSRGYLIPRSHNRAANVHALDRLPECPRAKMLVQCSSQDEVVSLRLAMRDGIRCYDLGLYACVERSRHVELIGNELQRAYGSAQPDGHQLNPRASNTRRA